jgi:hypothetical protein
LAKIEEEGGYVLVMIGHSTRILEMRVAGRKNTITLTEAIDGA